jgi:chaperonin cofactor prefoldin
MGLFKSKEEKRIEWTIEVRRGLARIGRQIKTLEKNERGYIEKAKRARSMGANDQFEFLKKTLKKTALQRRQLERQLLNLETAAQIKDQVEANASFATAMGAVSKAIGQMFGSVNLTKTQAEFERSMAQAENMEERIAIFMDMSAESMLGYEGDADELVSDDEIDRMLSVQAAEEESTAQDSEIAEGLSAVRAELKKDNQKR